MINGADYGNFWAGSAVFGSCLVLDRAFFLSFYGVKSLLSPNEMVDFVTVFLLGIGRDIFADMMHGG